LSYEVLVYLNDRKFEILTLQMLQYVPIVAPFGNESFGLWEVDRDSVVVTGDEAV